MPIKGTSQILGGFLDSMQAVGSTVSSPTADKHSKVERPIGEIRNRQYLIEQEFVLELERITALALDTGGVDRRRVERFKLAVLLALDVAASSPDPLIALFDVWSLAVQLRDFLESPSAASLLGDSKPEVASRATKYVEQVEAVAATLARDGNPDRAKKSISQWCGEHPIEDERFLRSSAAVLFAESAHRPPGGAVEQVVELADAVQDLSYRFKALSGRVPRALETTIGLVVDDALERVDIVGLQRSVDSLSKSVDNLEVVLNGPLNDLEKKVEMALEVVRDERTETLRQVEATASRLMGRAALALGAIVLASLLCARLLFNP